MVASTAKTVAAYMAELAPERRAALSRLRATIRKAVPRAKESMQHGMPAYGDVCGFASQKGYMALYVVPAVLKAHRKDFAHLDCGKCCIRFRKLADLPLAAVTKMLRAARPGIHSF